MCTKLRVNSCLKDKQHIQLNTGMNSIQEVLSKPLWNMWVHERLPALCFGNWVAYKLATASFVICPSIEPDGNWLQTVAWGSFIWHHWLLCSWQRRRAHLWKCASACAELRAVTAFPEFSKSDTWKSQQYGTTRSTHDAQQKVNHRKHSEAALMGLFCSANLLPWHVKIWLTLVAPLSANCTNN